MSVQKKILEAVAKAAMNILSGRGYGNDAIRIRRRPTFDAMPDGKKLVVSQIAERYIGDEATNEEDDVGYGVLLSFGQAGQSNPEYTDTFDEVIVDRELLRRRFHNDPDKIIPHLTLPAGLHCYGLKVEPGPMLMADFHANGIDASALVLRVAIREVHE